MVSDPVRYDRLSGRWFVLGIDGFDEQQDSPRGRLRSDDHDQSSFTFYSFNIGTRPRGRVVFCDYPGLGIDANALHRLQHVHVQLPHERLRHPEIERLSGGPMVVTGFSNIGSWLPPGPTPPRRRQ